MVKKFVFISIITVLSYIVLCNLLSTISNMSNFTSVIDSKTLISHREKVDTDLLGTIDIPKIKLQKNIYKLESPKNNIKYNVSILKGSILPNNKNSILFLAAHSGNGSNAYFDKIKYLKNGDKVYFNYKNVKYTYIINGKEEVDKTGYITGIRKNDNEIVLTTCSDKKDKQLIIYGILKVTN